MVQIEKKHGSTPQNNVFAHDTCCYIWDL